MLKSLQNQKKAKKMINLVDEIKEYNSIAIGAHIKPDGDAIGSTLGLFLYLTKVCPDKEIKLYLDKPLEHFNCIPGIENIDSSYSGKDPEVFICVDTIPERLGNSEKYWKVAKKTINIDHHITNANGSGDVNFVDPYASSASELVYRLIPKEAMDKDIATAIYIGIIHDTGMLKYSSTSPDTLRAVADLITYGFDFTSLVDATFYEKTFLQNVSSAKVVESSELHLDGKVISSCVSLKTMKKWNCTSNDLDGVINQLRITQGTELAVFMYQTNASTYKISLRSKNFIDCTEIATDFGGGGHVRASGFYTTKTPEETMARILELTKLQYDRQN